MGLGDGSSGFAKRYSIALAVYHTNVHPSNEYAVALADTRVLIGSRRHGRNGTWRRVSVMVKLAGLREALFVSTAVIFAVFWPVRPGTPHALWRRHARNCAG